MKYLHQSGIGSHGHLTSRNCVVNNRWNCLITDYGLHHLRNRRELIKSYYIENREGISRRCRVEKHRALSHSYADTTYTNKNTGTTHAYIYKHVTHLRTLSHYTHKPCNTIIYVYTCTHTLKHT